MKDDGNARIWRGDLVMKMKMPRLMWKEGGCYQVLQPPNSVTFPICKLCGHIVWDWPHFEEAVPEGAVCEQCFRHEQQAQRE